MLEYKFGDFHLGRSCRRRDESSPPPDKCEEPPLTPYSRLFDLTVSHSRTLSLQVKTSLLVAAIEGKNRLKQARENTCEGVPRSCADETSRMYERNWKQRLLCGHIPTCVLEDDNDANEPTPEDFRKTAVKTGSWYWQ